jgi:hypothetical protein
LIVISPPETLESFESHYSKFGERVAHLHLVFKIKGASIFIDFKIDLNKCSFSVVAVHILTFAGSVE